MARLSYEHEKYQVGIALSCLSVELYLKSVLDQVEHPTELETTHDIINIYRCLAKRYVPQADLMPKLVRCRKYFNEARYPASNSAAYTKEFCEEFLGCIDAVKDYVDNKCQAGMNDLLNKFKKKL